MTGDFVEALGKNSPQPVALERILETRIEGIDVRGQRPLPPEVVPDVLVGREHELVLEPKAAGERAQEGAGLRLARAAIRFVREERRVLPHGLAVLAPEAGKRPARQLLARIPLALAEVQETGPG